jgi:hypothetical protein
MKVEQEILDFCNKIRNSLDKEFEILKNESHYSQQILLDIQRGWVKRRSGIYEPYKKYRMLFETFHISILDSFIVLINNSFDYYNLPILNTVLRTFHEISFKRINTHFSSFLAPVLEKRIRLLCILTDFLIMGNNWKEEARMLFSEEKSNLKSDEIQIIGQLLQNYDEKLIKKIKARINNLYDNFKNNYVKDYPFLNVNNLTSIHSHLSHVIHADPVLLKAILEDKENSTARFIAMFIITTLNAAKRIYDFIKRNGVYHVKVEELDKIISELESNFNKIWDLTTKLFKR